MEAAQSAAPEAKAAAPVAESHLLEELALLELASKELRAGRRGAAASLLRKHERQYPKSSLAVERRGMSILAGCNPEAGTLTSAASAFVDAHPKSPLASHIRKRCLK
jgi:hypothetical protein